MMEYQTLHAHTTASDGKFGYLKLLDLCTENNIGVLAFTDHDSLPSLSSLNLLMKNKNHKTRWIIGVEISSGWPIDLGGGATSGLHLVGLFIDPTNVNLLDHCKKAKEARIVRMQKIVNNLNKIGFTITAADCLKASGGESVGRPHIVEAINYHPENKKIYDVLIERMRKDAEKNMQLAVKYRYLIERGVDQYPFILFLSENSYIPGIYVDYQYYSDFDKSVKLIRNAGGVAILAHWMSCKQKLDENFITDVFEKDRLDGAETVYGLQDMDTSRKAERENEMKIIEGLVDKTGKLKSGGCDAHTLQDLQEFKKHSRYAKKTVGLAGEILKSGKVDKQWSSL